MENEAEKAFNLHMDNERKWTKYLKKKKKSTITRIKNEIKQTWRHGLQQNYSRVQAMDGGSLSARK